eukprot:c15180_g1_i1.p1 GENE.c15180_g1_i1~~c15180_g1_i1.p1  ORF type:complete len:432 (-),score=92.48 c15180_g1_i1:152-1405(-)
MDVEAVAAAVRRSPDFVHRCDQNKCTPLHIASKHNAIEAMKILLEAGARVDQFSSEGKTPLHVAAEAGGIEALKLLIQYRADINAQTLNTEQMTGLHFAAIKNHIHIAKLLIDLKANVNIRSHSGGYAPIHLAAMNASVDVAKLLLDFGVDPNLLTSRKDWRPLHFAAKSEHSRNMTRLLLQRRANPNVLDVDGRSPLYFAVQLNNAEVAGELLRYGANVPRDTATSLSPVTYALKNDCVRVLEAMLASGATLNIPSADVSELKLANHNPILVKMIVAHVQCLPNPYTALTLGIVLELGLANAAVELMRCGIKMTQHQLADSRNVHPSCKSLQELQRMFESLPKRRVDAVRQFVFRLPNADILAGSERISNQWRKEMKSKAFAFLMATHPRLGQHSFANKLPNELIQKIVKELDTME